MSRLKQVLREAHQRSLWQALIVYLGASYAVLEAVALFRDEFGLPDWLLPVALVLLLIGLPVLIVTSLAKKEVYGDEVPEEHAAAAAEEDRRLRLLTWRTTGLSFLVALALWGVVAAGLLVFGGYGRVSADEHESVAVLPFENLSGNPDNEYFSDGITSDIINHLSRIADLKIISRTSVMQYKNTDKNLRQIGEELGVSAIVEGETRRIGDRVRINAQLIDAESDVHLWAEQYNRQATDVLTIQSDIAQQIAEALEATLTSDERTRIEWKPTDSYEAYDYYLRGNEYLERGYAEGSLSAAQELYERAISLDTTFALAYAKLARVHNLMYWFFHDRSEERLRLARWASETALRVDPDLAEGHWALGYHYYHGYLDYEQAMAHLSIALELEPNNSDVVKALAAVHRRQGDFETAEEYLLRVSSLDPLNYLLVWEAGDCALHLRNYEGALGYFDAALSLAPDVPEAYLMKAWTYLVGSGDVEKAAESVEVALETSAGLTTVVTDEQPWWLLRSVATDQRLELERLTAQSFGADTLSYFLVKAERYAHLGRPRVAGAYFDSVRAIAEREVSVWPGEARFHSLLGVAYAGLGRRDDAVREGRLATGLLPLSRDALWGRAVAENLAWIYVTAGEPDSAVATIETLLSRPGLLSVPWLRVDPLWDPLRDHTRFQALLERYE
jgi:serine/threonine-protein kinase